MGSDSVGDFPHGIGVCAIVKDEGRYIKERGFAVEYKLNRAVSMLFRIMNKIKTQGLSGVIRAISK